MDGSKLYCVENIFEVNKDFTVKNGAKYGEKYILFKKGGIYQTFESESFNRTTYDKSVMVNCELTNCFVNIKRSKNKLITVQKFREKRLKKLCLK
ncbi:MAG: hypothetical protein SLAVMIC_00242 [uncultured marine phage]|uniref:Uncharacterized protein n=1 Tax=uncultured marine phage TaxID=707152 RepID=A0A8D9CBX3_9VIRU|nr:MAG: hypothetical protein SLAVMIC_00242 [uncultured marine phage]